ncbi:class A beta-lactamase-related serine hydrolase [Candidatus Parcubacteria bacterium]|nr:class A beta-lactamase-related serine hydrolase [Candidatus Parcubacteria bacterium]
MKELAQWRYALPALAFVVGGLGGWYFHVHSQSIPPPISVREDSGQYHFVNPSLFTEISKAAYPDLNPLGSKLASQRKQLIEDDKAIDISIYFRTMNDGHWTGVNEDEVYSPGSLLKVTVLLSYLRAAELEPSILKKYLNYEAKEDPGQYYKPQHTLRTGVYTVEELLNAMIVESDNQASYTLIANDSKHYSDLNGLFRLPVPQDNADVTDFMSARTYSRLFRALYNASYLSAHVSDQALQLLTYTTFDNGIVAGVPAGVVVAHKFGEHRNVTLDGKTVELELHDCGVVYYPGNPYFLCIMTKGHDFPSLESVISNISSLTYDYVKTNLSAPSPNQERQN